MNFLIIQVVKSPMFADANIPNNLETACLGMMYCVAINKDLVNLFMTLPMF